MPITESGVKNPDQFDVVLEDVETGIRPRATKSSGVKKKRPDGWQFAGVAGEIGFDIVLPMALGLIVGRHLDTRWETAPTYTIVLFLVGLTISCASLIRIVRDSLKG